MTDLEPLIIRIKENPNLSAREKKELLFWAWDLLLAQNKKSEKMKTHLNKNQTTETEKKGEDISFFTTKRTL